MEERAADQIASPASTDRNPIDLNSQNESHNPVLVASYQTSSYRDESNYTKKLRMLKKEKSLYYESRKEADPEAIASDYL